MSTNLEIEINNYTNVLKQHDLTLFKLSQFFKTMSTIGINFIEKSKNSLEEYFIELKKENTSATHIISLIKFYNEFIKYFDKMKEIFQNINTQFSDKITEFSNEFKNSNNQSINNLIIINNQLKEEKINLEKAKNEYFKANKPVIDLEKKIIKLGETECKNDDFKKHNAILEKHMKILEDAKFNYLLEINKYNKTSVNDDKLYMIEVENIYNEQEKKIKFIYEILNNFKKELTNLSESSMELVNIIEKLNKSMNISRDVNLFKEEHNYYNEDDKNEKKRFMMEEFLDYDVLRPNEKGIKSVVLNEKKNNSNKKKGLQKKNEENTIVIQKINDLILKIYNETEKLNEKETNFLMEFVDKDKNSHTKLIDILMQNYNNKEIIIIKNFYNFNFLVSLIQIIIDRNSNCIESLYENFYSIVTLSENIMSIDNESGGITANLCKSIRNLSLFSKIKFWDFVIDKRIKCYTEEKTKADLDKKEKNKNIKNNTTEKQNNNYYSKIKDMFNFHNNNDNNNKQVENEIVFNKKYKDNLSLYCLEVIEKFIRHFSNFNLPKYKSIQIIGKVYDKYKFEKIYYDYFIAEINSNINISKKQMDIFEKKDIKIDYNNYNIKNKGNIEDKKLIAIINSINYLDLSDYQNIMILSKEYYKIIKKSIYTKLLIKYQNINIEKKIPIWKNILDYHENKRKYKYEEIKNKVIEKSESDTKRNVIDLDVIRTPFDKDKELNQKKTSYILKSIVEIVPELKYNQGMNYVVSFLLNITQNEEESFYLFLGLFTSTEYGELFKNDLAKLKKMFYIFERLISIFLPDLYNFFLENNIKVSYFISSWFITLFTNTFQFNKIKDNPKILNIILDLFFYYDWKSIIITGITLLKTYESKIFVLISEEILHFLTTGILKENFFENENFDKFIYIMLNFKIDDQLIQNIEKEIDIKRKMPDLGKNLSFQII